ncbi:TRAP transporter 4TM/12TM fusion protein [Scopulibacillus darangshiensis]|uniref:TRAP transporter 4TM/12TM fusion protein n=1 Tax=Scopulibacillus darangshiensis TaxID=442528 RepID=A0A4R2NGZ3_9BACL|nr:TRAP transporter permease [Scopulibacillus darangshiensis]TCP20653.1 TRAP transporter 4TM/12TM fusion protein [Scopulibacillus darangshiensis]
MTESEKSRDLAGQTNQEEPVGDGLVQYRKFVGPMAKTVFILAVIWSLFQIYVASFGIMEAIKSRAWFFAFLSIMIFLLCPASKKGKKQRMYPSIWDWICIAGTLASVGFLLLNYNGYVQTGLHIPLDFWFGGLGILVAFEAARRAAGNVMTILAAVFLLYNFFGQYIPGVFGHASLDFERVIDVMWWGTQGIFGTVIGVAATYIFLFILFGAFLRRSGFIDFINDLALAIAGRSAGGPAKVAVIGSGFMGMINGSGVANASSVGTVTIPLMKKAGFKGHFAGAVEAVAGTGGVIAPPIMGAASFVMAEFLGVPYRTIMLAALIPAILYFLMCFLSVHFEAKKLGIEGLSKERLPNIWLVLKRGGHLIIPVIVIIALLVTGMTPLYAAVWSMLSTVIVSWFKKETRMGLKEILEALEEGAKGVLTVGAACTIVGIIIGTISLTSLGLTLGNNILELAGNHLFLVAIFTMLISILLGMGVPVTASYIITATISAPLLAKMGVSLLVAHMFAFFFAALSDITPPVALAVMAAAGIAREPFIKVAVTAVRLGILGFLIPFFFLYNPLLLFAGGSIIHSIFACITGMIGVIALSGALANWFLIKLNVIQRILLTLAGLLMIEPNYYTDIFGVAALVSVYIWQKAQISAIRTHTGSFSQN